MSGPLDPFAELWQHEREQMARLNPPTRRLPPSLSDINISAQSNFMRDNTSLLANGPRPKLGNIHRPSRSDPDWFPTTSRYDNPDSPLFRPTGPESAGPSRNAFAPRPFGVDETSTSQHALAPRRFGLNEPSTSQNILAPRPFGLNKPSTSQNAFAPQSFGLNEPSTSKHAFAPRRFGLNEPSTSFVPRPFALAEPSTSQTVFAPRPSGLNEPSTLFAPRPFALDEPRNSRNAFAPRPFGLNAPSTSRNGFASRPFGLTGGPSTLDNTFYHSRPRVHLHPMPGTEEEKLKKLEATFLAGKGQDSSSTATRKRPLEISDEDDECPYRPQQSQNTPYGLTIAKSCPPPEQKEATDMHTLVSDTARIEHPSHEFTLHVPATPQVHPPGSWPETTQAATRFADLTDNYVPEQALESASSWAGLTARLTRVVGNNMTTRANNTARAVRGVGNHITQRATKTARVVRVVGHDIGQRATITARRAVNVVGTFKRRIQQVLHRDTNEHDLEDHRRGPPADSDMPLLDAASVVVDDALSSDVMDATPEPLHPVEMPSPADGIFELVEIDFSGFNFWSSRSNSSDTPSSGSATKPKSLKRAAPESEDAFHPPKKSKNRAPMAFSPPRTRDSFVRKMFPPALVGSLAVAEAMKAHFAGNPMPLKRINYRRGAYHLQPIRVPSTEVKETATQRPKIAQSQEVKTKSILKTSSNAVASSSKSSVVDATTVSLPDANHEKHTPKPKPSRKVHFPNSPVTGERIITPRNAPPAPRTPSPSPPRARIGHLQHLLDAHARNILSSEEDTDAKAITYEEQKENIAPLAPDTTSRDLMSTEVTSHDMLSTEITSRDMLSNEYMRIEDTNIEHVNTNQTTADEVVSHEGRSVIAQESNTLSQDPSTQEAEQHPMGRALSALESDRGGKRGKRGGKKKAQPATPTRKNPPRAARSATPKR
ncbi:hypothetical protein ASPACDRAFT_1854943 [Aspergillus aculeatus ATCC 16872]|uniref:Uncharacterized protein n=1 Tax=Aspergillus aculeatus (strain ATCC 16872 / CBS 172.66 / WB 5094) TaxID=690307 RepID=A0A1L9WZB7_ASPA1|nr:uncharacterized protein ASPACDRAFT_1854943 [Aspergillus aculeatus ATCC 16872]OJK01570.1 hypothetical protein ASPACDRAFT_1854943 [Aspergillus aculeatus ATCC 16872]